jgi:sulfate transport system ATP-binding protein
MEVSNRIVIFSRGNLEQIGSPREVYEEPSNEFVARFVGVLNVLEMKVSGGFARAGELQLPAHDRPEGSTLRIGFRPFAVMVSPNPLTYRTQAILRHTFFLGIMLRLELETPSGLILRARMTKEEYAANGLRDGMVVSCFIRRYRVLGDEGEPLSAEIEASDPTASTFGAGI